MNTKRPYALCLAEKLQDAYNATYRIKAVAELRRQHAEIETLRAGYDAARLEIASLHTQMEAVGAGGMEPLRKRCLHQISEPANAGWCDGCSPDNCGGCVSSAAPTQAGEYPAGTGNPEADRIIGRLASSDPDFDDCADAVALIHKLVAEIKGPDGFDTWKDAAIADRAAHRVAQAAPVGMEPVYQIGQPFHTASSRVSWLRACAGTARRS